LVPFFFGLSHRRTSMVSRRNKGEARHTGLTRVAQRAKLPKIRRRFHDAVDAASGKIYTTPVVRALTPVERVKRLARLGLGADVAAFGKPRYRLTPQKPYQSKPEAWLDAFDGTYSTGPGVDQIWWRLPASFPTEFMAGCNFSFRQLPAGPAVLSLAFEAWPYQGRTGTLVIDIGALRTEIPINVAVARTTDIGFVHDGAATLLTMVFFRPGLIDLVFHSVALGRGRPLVVAR
jgi:hypothetical protein